MAPKQGILLVNIGSPDSPEPKDVGRYLREFLMDPFVLSLPLPFRWLTVNAFIVPKRSHVSSMLYKRIWDGNGSPLIHHTRELALRLRDELGEGYQVAYGMRYGKPSLSEAIESLRHSSEIVLLPLYPQYSLAATQSSVLKVESLINQSGFKGQFKTVPPFFKETCYLDAVAAISRPHLESKPWDKVLFSFHGLPEHQVKATDPSRLHCRCDSTCCLNLHEGNKDCYRAQCYYTACEVAKRLGLTETQYLVSFQSRLRGRPWIGPFSDHLYQTLPQEGVKRLAVISPSFVADCLETLEEIAIRGKKQFVDAGGEDLFLVPSLNSEMHWVSAVKSLLETAITSRVRSRKLTALRSSHLTQ